MKPTSNTVSRAEPPRLALTAGEPAGIGPDLLVALAAQDFDACLTIIGDPAMLTQRATLLGLSLEIDLIEDPRRAPRHRHGKLYVCPEPLVAPAVPGRADPANAKQVLRCIERAARYCLDGICDAMTTGPVNKAVINRAGVPFSGHTEFLATLTGGTPVMMLAGEKLRVALVTTHLPLSRVAAAVTRESVTGTVRTVHEDLRHRFGIAQPALLVLGLNPHAGEDGHLGSEESAVLIPALESLRRDGLRITGPLAADTAFTADRLRGIDAVIAMYHDQGLAPLKALEFGGIVNITLGLPIVRTSVDHGTALDVAGSGRARTDSLIRAVQCALDICRRRDDRPAAPAAARLHA